MRELRSLAQAIVVELLEQLAYLGLRVQAAEKSAEERVQNRQACLPCSWVDEPICAKPRSVYPAILGKSTAGRL